MDRPRGTSKLEKSLDARKDLGKKKERERALDVAPAESDEPLKAAHCVRIKTPEDREARDD